MNRGFTVRSELQDGRSFGELLGELLGDIWTCSSVCAQEYEASISDREGIA